MVLMVHPKVKRSVTFPQLFCVLLSGFSRSQTCGGAEHHLRQAFIGTTLSLSALAPRQAGNTRATCRGNVDKATASPAAHKRVTGKYLIDVFGGNGSLSKATNHWGLRGDVLDTKFGLKYDVTTARLHWKHMSNQRQKQRQERRQRRRSHRPSRAGSRNWTQLRNSASTARRKLPTRTLPCSAVVG